MYRAKTRVLVRGGVIATAFGRIVCVCVSGVWAYLTVAAMQCHPNTFFLGSSGKRKHPRFSCKAALSRARKVEIVPSPQTIEATLVTIVDRALGCLSNVPEVKSKITPLSAYDDLDMKYLDSSVDPAIVKGVSQALPWYFRRSRGRGRGRRSVT